MFAQAMKGILESGDFARAADIAEVAHFSMRNPSSQPNRWKKAGLIFAVPYKGGDLYPFYALDLSERARSCKFLRTRTTGKRRFGSGALTHTSGTRCRKNS
jgi:hypothetical protein